MEQIIIQVKDKEKARKLFDLLTELDFVSSVMTREVVNTEVNATTREESSDFFSLAGIWKGREISLETIRQKAWPKQYT